MLTGELAHPPRPNTVMPSEGWSRDAHGVPVGVGGGRPTRAEGPEIARGMRTIVMPGGLRADLFAEDGGEGRLFVGKRGATLHRPKRTPVWAAARSAAELDPGLHLHDLRHTGNHFAAACGTSTRELMHRMRRASMRAALIYQHATAEGDARIADALNRVYSGGAEQ